MHVRHIHIHIKHYFLTFVPFNTIITNFFRRCYLYTLVRSWFWSSLLFCRTICILSCIVCSSETQYEAACNRQLFPTLNGAFFDIYIFIWDFLLVSDANQIRVYRWDSLYFFIASWMYTVEYSVRFDDNCRIFIVKTVRVLLS